MLVIIVSTLYLCNYRSVEEFIEPVQINLRESNKLPPKEHNHTLYMNKPFHINAKSVEFDEIDVDRPLKLETDMIKMNDNIIINSEQSLYFKDNKDELSRLSKDNLLDLKKNASKIKYLDTQLCDVISMENGDVKGCHSSKTTANDECTSKLWELAIGKNVTKQALCAACCKNVKKSSIFKAFISLNMTIHEEAYVNLMNNKTYDLIELSSSPNTTYNATISFYRNNTSLDAKLTLLNIPAEAHNRIRTTSSLDELKTFISTTNSIVKSFESKKTDPSGTLIVWGHFRDGMHIPTTIHVDSITTNFALLEVLHNDY